MIFDGPNKRIILESTAAVSAQVIYSAWKDWMLVGTNSAFAPAFRSVAGDPIGGGNAIAPYYFLNTTDGWRIRPDEADHELRVSGNLYSEDPALSMFAPTLGDYTVVTIIERSASAIAVASGSGLSSGQAIQLAELHKLAGLDVAAPLVVTSTTRTAGDLEQGIVEAPAGTVTVTRQP